MEKGGGAAWRRRAEMRIGNHLLLGVGPCAVGVRQRGVSEVVKDAGAARKTRFGRTCQATPSRGAKSSFCGCHSGVPCGAKVIVAKLFT